MAKNCGNVVTEAVTEFGYSGLARKFASKHNGRETISPQAIRKWERDGVPAERALEFERVTGISRTRVRPDIYPPEAVA